jgi:DNA anti-recombination protein RmuC
MPVAIPQTVRRALGEEAVVDFMPWMERWLSESIKEKAVPRDEYREVLSRLDGLEKAISLVKEELTKTRAEFRQEQAQMRAEFREDLGELRREMHERFDRVNGRFDEMGARFDGRLDDMHHQMIVQTRWLIGSLALIGTVVSVLLAIAQFTP